MWSFTLNLLKNIVLAALVLAISIGVFTIMEEKETAESILASIAEMLLDPLIAGQANAEQRAALEMKRDSFIKNIDDKKINEDQFKTTVARLYNLALSPDSLSAAELNAVLDESIQPISNEKNPPHLSITKAKAQHIERRIAKMQEFQKQVDSIQNDSIRIQVARQAMVTPDSDLQLVLNDEILHDPRISDQPEIQQFIQKLPKKGWVKFESFSNSPDISRQALKFYAPGLPSNIRMSIVVHPTLGEPVSISLDSIKNILPSNFYDSAAWEQWAKQLEDSVEKWIEDAE
jgi:hypothetical protein